MYKELNYHRKVEPLQKWEVFACGICLQLWVIFLNILPWLVWSTECSNSVFNTNIKDFDDLESVHNCINKHKSGLLASSTLLLLGYPIILSHLHFHNRIYDTLLSFLNLYNLKSLYNGSWTIVITIYCTIVPGISIFIGYYNWEFADSDINSEYYNITLLQMGYAMQYQFLHFLLIVMDTIIIPIGIATVIPYFIQLLIIFGYANSQHYKLNNETRMQMLFYNKCCFKGNNNNNNNGIFKWIIVSILIGLIIVILFSTFGDVFDFDKTGFFSYQGGSQYLSIILLFAWEIQAIFTILLAFQFDSQINFLNENVKSIVDQDSLANF